MANLGNVIDRLIAEGDLTRNTGTNSIKSLKESIDILNFNTVNYLETLVKQGESVAALYANQMKTMEGLRYDLLEAAAESKARDVTPATVAVTPEQEAIRKEGQGIFNSFRGIGNTLQTIATGFATYTGLRFIFRSLSGLFSGSISSAGLASLITRGGIVGLGLGSVYYLYQAFKDLADDPIVKEFQENWNKAWTGVKARIKAISDFFSDFGLDKNYFKGLMGDIFGLPGEGNPEGGVLFQAAKGWLKLAMKIFDFAVNPGEYASKLYTDTLFPIMLEIESFFTNIKNKVAFFIKKTGLDIQKRAPEFFGGLSDQEYDIELKKLEEQYGDGRRDVFLKRVSEQMKEAYDETLPEVRRNMAKNVLDNLYANRLDYGFTAAQLEEALNNLNGRPNGNTSIVDGSSTTTINKGSDAIITPNSKTTDFFQGRNPGQMNLGVGVW